MENVFHDILVDRSIGRSMVFFLNHPYITMCIFCMCIFICPEEEVEWQISWNMSNLWGGGGLYSEVQVEMFEHVQGVGLCTYGRVGPGPCTVTL